MYFEKQGALSNQCGRCALNNLLGDQIFTSEALNDICYQLEKDVKQNYRHILGGDYDVNVLMEALKVCNKQTKWMNNSSFQERKGEIGRNADLTGFIINQKQKPSFFKNLVGLSDRHWVAVKQTKGSFYLFDSKAESSSLEPIESIIAFLQQQILRGSHIIEVYDQN